LSRAILLGASLSCALALAGCDAIVGAGDRKLNTSVTCDSTGCKCARGYGDCDKDPDNGCETDLTSPKSCGACGVACANGKCDAMTLSCACEGGFGECDGDPKTVCETDLQNDSAHCGACDRDCAGQGCSAGLCKSAPIKGAGTIYNFILRGKTMYFAPLMSQGIASVSVDGGTPTPIGTATEYATVLFEKDGTVYWGGETKIFSTVVATGQSTELATNQVPAFRIAVAGSKVYWENVTMADNSLWLRRTGVTPGGMMPEDVVKLGDAKYIYDFAVSDDAAYWADVTAVMRTPHDKLAPTLFLNVPKPPIYFETTADTMFFTAQPSGVFSLPFKGNDTTQLADVPGYGVLAVDDVNVYFEPFAPGDPNPPSIWRASRTGVGAPVKLVSDPFLALGFPIAVDDKWLYWINTNQQTVVRISK
jgi:hypothetical protein